MKNKEKKAVSNSNVNGIIFLLEKFKEKPIKVFLKTGGSSIWGPLHQIIDLFGEPVVVIGDDCWCIPVHNIAYFLPWKPERDEEKK